MLKVSKCWRASISLGAINAACPPDSTHSSMAITATNVLPEPTSPCSNLFIFMGLEISSIISSLAQICASVGENGNEMINFLTKLPIDVDAKPVEVFFDLRAIAKVN